MNGENVAQQDHPDPPAPQVAEPERLAPEQPATAQQLDNVKKQMSAFERSTLKWARAAVIVSGLAFAVVCAQWWEMHTGSEDTHKLAVAAGNQATWTERLARNTDTESAHMKELADHMKEQTDQTKNLADQSVVQAKAARSAAEEAELSQRPWIKIVDVKTRGNGDLIPALSFQGFGYGVFPATPYHAVTLQVGVSLENVGHSVAEIYVQPSLYLPLWGQGNGFSEKALAEQRRRCANGSMPRRIGTGQTIFPGEQYEWNGGVSSPVNATTIDYLRNPNPPGSWPPIVKNNPNGYVMPKLILCVNYRLSGSSGTTYQTQALYTAIRKADRTMFFDVGQDVKERDIELLRDSSGDRAQ